MSRTDTCRSSSYGLTNKSQTLHAGSGNRYITNTAPDGSYSVSFFQNGLVQSVTRKDALNNQLSSVTFAYDAHGRRRAVTDARNGTTASIFDNADRVISVTTPPPGTGGSGQTTTFAYDFAGHVIRTGLPDGGGVTNVYSQRGDLLTNFGSRVYPVAYGYDAQSRRTNMVTWTNFANRTGAATTTWKFNGYRGFMTNKLYADGKGPFYSYTPAGRQRTRIWARGITTTYETNSAGEIVGLTYSDGTTSNVVYNLDRQGRRTNIVDGSGNRFFKFSDAGLQLVETNASGLLAGTSLTNGYDSLNRRTTLAALSNGTPYFVYTYGYDSASRLTNVSDGTYQADYIYLANSPLVSQIIMRSNSAVRMTATKFYDFLNRLLMISNAPSADSAIAFAYKYNQADQRTRRTDSDGSYWIYKYDSFGQLISGKHYWSDGTPVAGQQFEYSYDDIGNRVQTKAGGDASGANLQVANYRANNLNQYTQVDIPGVADIMGISHPNASATVNGQAPSRKGEYYQAELTFANSSATLFPSITNQAVFSGVTNTTVGNLLIPKTPQSFWYDFDGNMIGDGVWTNSWDAENRLTAIEATSLVPTAARAKEVWSFDGAGRWVQRIIYSWSGSAYVAASTNRFLWDGAVLLGVLDQANTCAIAVRHALDLQGTSDSAGITAVNEISNGTQFCVWDGNHSIAALVTASDGHISGRYSYDPFGKLNRVTGQAANDSFIRFSSQFQDTLRGSVKYLYRDAQDTFGRWLSRDPIAENGGLNVYSFAANSPISNYENLGLTCNAPPSGIPGMIAACRPCCCCADDLTIANITPYSGSITIGSTLVPKAEGHSFDAVAKLSFQSTALGGLAGGCRMTWVETSNIPTTGIPGMIPGVPIDMFLVNIPGGTVSQKAQWDQQTSNPPCPGCKTISIHDIPAIGVPYFGPPRSLSIAITLYSTDNCPCSSPSKSVTFNQTLVFNSTGFVDRQNSTPK